MPGNFKDQQNPELMEKFFGLVWSMLRMVQLVYFKGATNILRNFF